MPRTLSSTARRAVLAAQTGEVFVVLLEISHASLPSTIRVTSDYPSTTHDGLEYQHFPFRVGLSDETEDAPSPVTLTIDAVDRRVVEAVRSVNDGELELSLKVVLASSPDTVEVGPIEFYLADAKYDAQSISGALVERPDLLREPCPAESVTPATVPGVFKG